MYPCDASGALRASFRIYAAWERSADGHMVRGGCMASGEAISGEFWTVPESRRSIVIRAHWVRGPVLGSGEHPSVVSALISHGSSLGTH